MLVKTTNCRGRETMGGTGMSLLDDLESDTTGTTSWWKGASRS